MPARNVPLPLRARNSPVPRAGNDGDLCVRDPAVERPDVPEDEAPVLPVDCPDDPLETDE
jgi:hypothetical protein